MKTTLYEGVSAGLFVGGAIGTLLGLFNYPLIYFSTVLLMISLIYITKCSSHNHACANVSEEKN